MTESASNKKPLAFIIEDERELAELFARALQMAEFDTEIIRNGNAALARLATTVPTLVVLDLHLPYVSGVDILNHIRGDDRLVKTRVMLATADPHMADVLREKSDLVLIKPISFFQLRDLAARLRLPDTTV
jgi:DNA-binding response OmpR family regulator